MDRGIWKFFALQYDHSRPTFEILRDDFALALDYLSKFENGETVDTLGEHLFTYYLWEVYPLRGKE